MITAPSTDVLFALWLLLAVTFVYTAAGMCPLGEGLIPYNMCHVHVCTFAVNPQ